jgi:hypothetical protein
MRWPLNGAKDADWEEKDSGDEFKGTGNGDADQAEWEEDKPDERIEDEGGQGEGPA